MDYSYEFVKILPKSLWVQVRYSADGHPDILKHFTTEDFSESGLSALAERAAPEIIKRWETVAALPEEVILTNPVKTATYVPVTSKPVNTAVAPAYDPFTERLVETKTETATAIEIGYNVVPLTSQEQSEVLQNWRASMVVTMRQARLALQQSGLLDTIIAARAQLPSEEQAVFDIEWEYSGVIERNSAWVTSLGPLLSLTDAELDELFLVAGGL